MDSNIQSNGPDHGRILQNMDQGISRDHRRGSDYLGKILLDNANNHLVDTIPDNDHEGAS